MQIRTANFSDLKDVKKLYRKAFPLIERKPFFMIWDKMQTGESEILVFLLDGVFAGFAVTLIYSDLVLVDYFAVSESFRGAGIGSEALKTLFARYNGKKVMLVAETENPKASNAKERAKRIKFYLKNSMVDTMVRVNILGSSFNLLSYPGKVSVKDYLTVNNKVMGRFFTKLTLTKIS